MNAQAPDAIRPPNDAERGILMFWLETSKRQIDQLEAMQSPYAEYLDDFCGLMYDVLNPAGGA